MATVEHQCLIRDDGVFNMQSPENGVARMAATAGLSSKRVVTVHGDHGTDEVVRLTGFFTE